MSIPGIQPIPGFDIQPIGTNPGAVNQAPSDVSSLALQQVPGIDQDTGNFLSSLVNWLDNRFRTTQHITPDAAIAVVSTFAAQIYARYTQTYDAGQLDAITKAVGPRFMSAMQNQWGLGPYYNQQIYAALQSQNPLGNTSQFNGKPTLENTLQNFYVWVMTNMDMNNKSEYTQVITTYYPAIFGGAVLDAGINAPAPGGTPTGGTGGESGTPVGGMSLAGLDPKILLIGIVIVVLLTLVTKK